MKKNDLMNIEFRRIESIKEYEKNPRIISDKAVEAVSNSLLEFGFRQPIVIDTNSVIIAGHTRYKAALKLGLQKVPVHVATDLSPEQVKAYRIADNKTGEIAEWNLELLPLEIADIKMDLSLFSFESNISPDSFNDSFNLAAGDKSEYIQITITVHQKQADLIFDCIEYINSQNRIDKDKCFGNTNKNGNGIYHIVKQWSNDNNIKNEGD